MPDHGPRYGKPLIERIAPDGKWTRKAVLRATPLVLFVILLLSVLFRTLATGSLKGIVFTMGLLAIFFAVVAIMMNNRIADLFARFIVPQGNASPYQRDFSFEKSLVMQGRVPEALEAYEAQIRARPTEPDAYMQAAELNVSSGSVERAVVLFRSVRLLETVTESQRIYATNRLIDLHYGSGPAENAERAKSELRYLIVHFPGSPAAAKAKELLARGDAEKRGD